MRKYTRVMMHKRLKAPVPTYSGFKRVEWVDEVGRQYHFPTAIEVREVEHGKKCIQIKIPIPLTHQTGRTPSQVQFPRPGSILKLRRIKRASRGGRRLRRQSLSGGYEADDEMEPFTIRIVSIIFTRVATGLLEYE